MLSAALQQLLYIASPALGVNPAQSKRNNIFERIPSEELQELANCRNGFFAFEGALRVFPSESVDESYGVLEWNSLSLWRREYNQLADGYFFFAEDIFGGQFGVKNDKIFTFDPETGQGSEFADNLEKWAQKILLDYDTLTGTVIAKEWQTRSGKLPGRSRLIPKTPFVLGGEYKLDNLAAMDAVRGMVIRGSLARQIHDLPDGSKVKFEILP